MSYRCPACADLSFRTAKGLASHRRSCRPYKTLPANALRSRLEDFRRSHREPLEQADNPAMLHDQEALGREVDLNLEQPHPIIHKPPVVTHAYRPSGLPARKTKLPRVYLDLLPPLSGPVTLADLLASAEDSSETTSGSLSPCHDSLPDRDSSAASYTTQPNNFGVYREYAYGIPSYTPDEFITINDLCNASTFIQSESLPSAPSPGSDAAVKFYAPFSNASLYRLMHWYHTTSSLKSLGELNRLVKSVLLAEDFDIKHLENFSAVREAGQVDAHQDTSSSIFSENDGWIGTSVSIAVPIEKRANLNTSKMNEATAPRFNVHGLYYRSITAVIKSALKESNASQYHLAPFKEFWQMSPDDPVERLYSEIYSCDTVIKEHRAIQHRTPECRLEKVIIPIMMWSDSTQLTSFGAASLWPIYLFLGNLSKYVRSKPSSFSAHHIAYIPTLSDTFQDWYRRCFRTSASAAVLTHCKRELIHAIWTLMMDDDVIVMYRDGIICEFIDGIHRRAFIRFITHSADYPEKVLWVCIRHIGKCLCPRCLVEIQEVHKMGTKADLQNRVLRVRVDNDKQREKITKARKLVYQKGASVNGNTVKHFLGAESMVPTTNAFSAALSAFGFNYFLLYVVDLLHEFELGIWRNTFIHLLRILYAYGGEAIQTLNERYRQVPSFGRSTIRRFRRNVSGMKKLAARDFEDLLQANRCAIPVFEHLLPSPHNEIVLDLLFELAYWHALAKLRLHTNTTLSFLESSTTRLGRYMRHLKSYTCKAFRTVELPNEETARRRRTAVMDPRNHPSTAAASSDPKVKQLNLSTYKWHALGDYAETIRRYGTTDNYSTQTGELEHRRVKRFYKTANKANFTEGIARRQRRERILHKMSQGEPSAEKAKKDDPLPPTAPESRYHMSANTKSYSDIYEWIGERSEDTAFQNFIPRLKSHLLGRSQERSYQGDEHEFTPQDRRGIHFTKNRIYHHKTVRFNYTTYDLRRDQDSISPDRRADVMLLSHEDDTTNPHPYWYARVIGIFHTFVQIRDPTTRKFSDSKRFDVLHVRWFGRNLDVAAGWKAKRLHRIGFMRTDHPDAFGFLDPAQVIRGVHLIPRFAGGTSYPGQLNITREQREANGDWLNYYVNCFVDRDMFMRFRGGGVGHKSTNQATRCVYEDRDITDTAGHEMDESDDDESASADEQTDEEDQVRNMDSDGGRSDGEDCRSDDSELDATPLDVYEVEGYAEF